MDSTAKISLEAAVAANDLASARAALEQGSKVPPPTSQSAHYSDDAASLRSSAASQGNLEMLQLLSLPQHTAHFSSKEAAADELLCLRRAAQNGHLDIIKLLLSETKASADEVKSFHSAMLLGAADKGHVPIVRYNIEHGADLQVESSIGEVPLMYACTNGHTEVVKEFLNAGVVLNPMKGRPNYGELWRATYCGHLDIMRLLLDYGANRPMGDRGVTIGPLVLRDAAEAGRVAPMELLFERGVKLDEKSGAYAARKAFREGHVDVLRLLAEHGVDLISVVVQDAGAVERMYWTGLTRRALMGRST